MTGPGFVLVATGLAFEAAVARRGEGARVCCGQGDHLVATLETALDAGCRGVLSFGIAAALDPDLKPGTAVVASQVVLPGGDMLPVDPTWRRTLADTLPAVEGRLLGVDRPIADAETKGLLRTDTGAAVVDMESHRAAAFAARHTLRFAALRVVADAGGTRVPQTALRAVRSDGTSDIAAVLHGLARQPSDILPLIRVARETGRARRTLVGARRRLGFGFGLLDIG